MWIERLRVRGFGMLSEREFSFHRDRVNLLVDSNEQGKSTLLHALLAGIYGLHRVQSGRRYSTGEEARYRPWEGKRYGVEIDLRLDEAALTIRRNLARKEVKVFRDAKDVTEEYRAGKALVPVGDLLSRLDEIDHDRPVALLCRSGNRSRHAAAQLAAHGFTDVTNLAGGVLALSLDQPARTSDQGAS